MIPFGPKQVIKNFYQVPWLTFINRYWLGQKNLQINNHIFKDFDENIRKRHLFCHYGIQYIDNQYNNIQLKGTQYNDIKHSNTLKMTLIITTIIIIEERYYAEFHLC